MDNKQHDKPTSPLLTSTDATHDSPPAPSKVSIHRRRVTSECEGLLFSPTRTHMAVYDMNQQSCQLDVFCQMDRGFFLFDDVWTCYRRNYFQLTTSCTLSVRGGGGSESFGDFHAGAFSVVAPDKSSTLPITQFLVRVVVRASDGNTNASLVQMTAKRDKGPQSVPGLLPIRPTIVNALDKQGTASLSPIPSSTSSSGPLDPLLSSNATPNTTSTNSTTPSATNATTPRKTVTFDRLQFKSATANNGKKRAVQQYFHLHVDLLVETENQQLHVVASTETCPLVVRGRSPGHYNPSEPKATENTANGASVSPLSNNKRALPPQQASQQPTKRQPSKKKKQRMVSSSSSSSSSNVPEGAAAALMPSTPIPQPSMEAYPAMAAQQQPSAALPSSALIAPTPVVPSNSFFNFAAHGRSFSANDSHLHEHHHHPPHPHHHAHHPYQDHAAYHANAAAAAHHHAQQQQHPSPEHDHDPHQQQQQHQQHQQQQQQQQPLPWHNYVWNDRHRTASATYPSTSSSAAANARGPALTHPQQQPFDRAFMMYSPNQWQFRSSAAPFDQPSIASSAIIDDNGFLSSTPADAPMIKPEHENMIKSDTHG